jgi:hypothetical protein
VRISRGFGSSSVSKEPTDKENSNDMRFGYVPEKKNKEDF